MIARLLTWLATYLHVITITRGWQGEPYLFRYNFRPRGSVFRRKNWGVYLHHFVQDDDHEFHNHPFEAASLILTGGYYEWRRVGAQGVECREVRPGTINRIRPDTFHRVELRDPKRGCWTLFFYWDRQASWGFWNPITKRYVDWKRHREAHREHTLHVVNGGAT